MRLESPNYGIGTAPYGPDDMLTKMNHNGYRGILHPNVLSLFQTFSSWDHSCAKHTFAVCFKQGNIQTGPLSVIKFVKTNICGASICNRDINQMFPAALLSRLPPQFYLFYATIHSSGPTDPLLLDCCLEGTLIS